MDSVAPEMWFVVVVRVKDSENGSLIGNMIKQLDAPSDRRVG